MGIHLIPKPFDYTTIPPVFCRDVHCQGSHCNANLQVQQILNHTRILNFHIKRTKLTDKKQTTKKTRFKGRLYHTCVLTFGGPLWNFFSKVCIKKKKKRNTKLNHIKYCLYLNCPYGHGWESINQSILPRACEKTKGYMQSFELRKNHTFKILNKHHRKSTKTTQTLTHIQ